MARETAETLTRPAGNPPFRASDQELCFHRTALTGGLEQHSASREGAPQGPGEQESRERSQQWPAAEESVRCCPEYRRTLTLPCHVAATWPGRVRDSASRIRNEQGDEQRRQPHCCFATSASRRVRLVIHDANPGSPSDWTGDKTRVPKTNSLLKGLEVRLVCSRVSLSCFLHLRFAHLTLCLQRLFLSFDLLSVVRSTGGFS